MVSLEASESAKTVNSFPAQITENEFNKGAVKMTRLILLSFILVFTNIAFAEPELPAPLPTQDTKPTPKEAPELIGMPTEIDAPECTDRIEPCACERARLPTNPALAGSSR